MDNCRKIQFFFYYSVKNVNCILALKICQLRLKENCLNIFILLLFLFNITLSLLEHENYLL